MPASALPKRKTEAAVGDWRGSPVSCSPALAARCRASLRPTPLPDQLLPLGISRKRMSVLAMVPRSSVMTPMSTTYSDLGRS